VWGAELKNKNKNKKIKIKIVGIKLIFEDLPHKKYIFLGGFFFFFFKF
jgi:hypothetical protein